jgi:hypothetical protein
VSTRNRMAGIGSLLACLLLASALAGCTEGTSSDSSNAQSPSVAGSGFVASSIETAQGTWATVPVGRLSDPLNTFWQLLFKRTEARTWSNDVQRTAVATNGGILLAVTPTGQLIAGVRPSNLLTFSPLISTNDDGDHWTNGLFTPGLSDDSTSLAIDSSGRSLAISGTGGDSEVLQAKSAVGAWSLLINERQMDAQASLRACEFTSLTAVAFDEGSPVVGGTCRLGGVLGVATFQSGHWRLDSVVAPDNLGTERFQAVFMRSGEGDMSALFCGVEKQGSVLVSATIGTNATVKTSPPLRLEQNATMTSVSTDMENHILVLLTSPSGDPDVEEAEAGSAWTRIPAPPLGTRLVGFVSGEGVVAMTPSLSVLRISMLNAARTRWVPSETMDVPVQYGSSS